MYRLRSPRETLNAAQIDALFDRVRRFCELAVQPTFINGLEETSPTFEAAWIVYSHRSAIRRIRVIALSNARLSTRRKPEMTGEVLGVPFVCNILDFARYIDISAAHGGAEPIEINVTELNGAPLPCLPAHDIGGDHASYLVAVPGRLLAEIYGLYGARLLEQNVRTFLQAKTKVNAGIIKTLETAPEMFFAYNNGLTATASGIATSKLPDGTLGIAEIENLQIVNGGQTTASILYASDQRKADLTGVFVQMKLSVVNPQLHEPGDHRHDQLRRIRRPGVPAGPCENGRISLQISKHHRRQFDSDLYGLIVGNGGELQFGHVGAFATP